MIRLAPSAVRSVAIALVVLGAAERAHAASPVSPRDAVEAAVRRVLGAEVASVEVVSLETRLSAEPGLVAAPDPAGRVGAPTRFAFTVGGRWRGSAVADVRVRARVAKTIRAIDRAEAIDASAVQLLEADIAGVRYGRLVPAVAIVGMRARRRIDSGALLTAGMVDVPPAVQNGDRITVGVTVGQVHVTTEAVASGSGQVGDVVRVMQPGRRVLLKARIVEKGVVEVIP